MQTPGKPHEVESLILETALCRARVDGELVDLPPKEFQLLVELATRPGEAMASRDLIKEVWPENPVMTPQDLYWYVWRLRKRLGDDVRARKLLGNRPRVGYLLDLPVEAVTIQRIAPTAETVTEAETAAGRSRSPRRRIFSVRRVAVVAATLVVVAGTSWAAGYSISHQPRRAANAAPAVSPSHASTALLENAAENRHRARHESHRKRKARDRHRHNHRDRKASGRPTQQVVVAAAPAAPAAPASSGSSQPSTGHQTSTQSKSSSTKKSGGITQRKIPPQPDATLYTLYNPRTGDHFMTTSTSQVDQKRAYGYNTNVPGRVFTTHIDGTVAITIDAGTAYIYATRSAAPKEWNIATLYELTLNDDFFYTSSSSKADSAAGDGWSKRVVGYIWISE